MADIPRQSTPRIAPTPISASPSRPSPLSRPHWPYTTYTHRPSSSMSNSNSSWDPRASTMLPSHSNFLVPGTGTPARRSSATSSLTQLSGGPEDTMRHWSYTAFEWIIRDVHKLKDYVENSDPSDSETPSRDSEHTPNTNDFDILKESPTLGDGKFKLEIAKSAVADTTNKIQLPTLSLFVTSVMLEYAHADYEMYTSMFAAIKCQDDRAGERGARADWAWEFWQNDWVFREDSEVWECPLPPLSVLLENPRIKETDSFVICVQIHSPVGPFFPQQPFATYVPRDLLDGLEASLDNANTGDVRFVCLERKEPEHSVEVEVTPESPDTETASNRRSSATSTVSGSSHGLARKRIIYAHSDILKRRSDYFTTMLTSSFSESATTGGPHERRIYTIVVEEADFVTIYWLLKWVYGNWLLFREHDDPKLAVEGVGGGWSAKTLSGRGRGDEWEWKAFSKGNFESTLDGSDTRSIASSEGVPSVRGNSRASAGKAKKSFSSGANQTSSTMRSPVSTRPRLPSTSKAPTSPVRPPPSPTRRSTSAPSNAGNPSTLTVPAPPPVPLVPNPRSNNSAPITASPTATTFPSSSPHYPISPRQQRQRTRPSLITTSDPHPHPSPPPTPASALSMYQVAHRYSMPGLAALALEHMMSTITPQSSFALLLATSTWDELHTLVEDYVVDKWEDVSVSTEFEQCCQEVAGGEWGAEGGKTMMALFRRLRSPSSLSFSRA